MDIRLFAAVITRFRKIAIAGLVGAVALAGLAYTRAGGTPTWNAQAEVLITQTNDPYGGPTATVLQEGGYLSGLATVYAAMANGDPVQAMIRRDAGVPRGTVSAAEVIDPPTGNVTPLITLTSAATSGTDAVKLAEKAPSVLQQYITRQQDLARVPQQQRVQLAVVKHGLRPELASTTSITVPLLVVMGVLGAVITLIFMLENLDPKTAEKLGRVTRSANGGDVASRDVATVLAALAQNLHQEPNTAPADGRPVNGHGGATHPSPVHLDGTAARQMKSGHGGTSAPEDAGAGLSLGDAESRFLRSREEHVGAAKDAAQSEATANVDIRDRDSWPRVVRQGD